VYFRADFSAPQLQQLGQATAWAFAFLLPQTLVLLYGTVFAALGRTRPLVLTAVVMLAALLTAAPLAVWLGGLSGVMAAYGLVYVVGALLLSWLAWRDLGAEPFRLAMGLDGAA
jgi:O-antigen/teichoic acid export membrane protein